jgi:hypothetical protein
MNAFPRLLALAVSGALVLTLGGCGGDSDDNDDCARNPSGPGCVRPSPSPAAVRTVLLTGSLALPSSTVDVEPFAVPAAGALDITVDWTFPASPIGVYVVRGACDLDRFNDRTCDFLTRSETGAKPRVLSLPNVAAGDYFLLIANFADEDESLSLQIGHTTGGSASAAQATGDAGRGDDHQPRRTVKALARNR